MPSPAPANATAPNPAVRALRLVVAWALGLVLLAGTGAALGVALYPTVTGGQALAVLSGSMRPGLPVGGMVFTREVDPATVGVGDVITFQHPSDPTALVTHRVIAVDTSSGSPVFTTQGDANEDPDVDPVPASAVQGELWFSVPQIGRVTAVLHSPRGVGVLVVLVCGLLAAHPGKRPAHDEPDAAAPADVDADNARTVVMAPVAVEPETLLVGAARPAVPVPPRPMRLLD
ncbi:MULTISPECIES: signal peptidase I [unclassified Blastococcus]